MGLPTGGTLRAVRGRDSSLRDTQGCVGTGLPTGALSGLCGDEAPHWGDTQGCAGMGFSTGGHSGLCRDGTPHSAGDTQGCAGTGFPTRGTLMRPCPAGALISHDKLLLQLNPERELGDMSYKLGQVSARRVASRTGSSPTPPLSRAS